MSRDSAQQQILESCAAEPRRQPIHVQKLSLLVHIHACDFTHLSGAFSLLPVATVLLTYAKLDQLQICRASQHVFRFEMTPLVHCRCLRGKPS